MLPLLTAGLTACGSAPGLPGELRAQEHYPRYRQVLDGEVLRRIAWFEPGARNWTLLVTEHRGASAAREILDARERYADRWSYLEVGPAAGMDIGAHRALSWTVTQPRPGAPAYRTLHAAYSTGERTVMLEYRGAADTFPSFDTLRRELARYR